MKKIISFLISFSLLFSLAIQSTAAGNTIDGNYTGWATSRSTGNRFYLKDGVKVTGVYVIDDTRHVFDEKGVWLGSRTNSRETYSVIFDNNYNVNIKDGKISFGVKVNDFLDKDAGDFIGNPYFSLFVYKDGRWKAVRYVSNDTDDYATGIGRDMLMRFSMPLSAFDFDFAPGLYRVVTTVTNGDRDENGNTIWVDVRGEFNLV